MSASDPYVPREAHARAEALPADSPAMTAGRQAAADLQQLLAGIGAAPDLVHRVERWANLEETEERVYVPPMPVSLVERLVQLVRTEVGRDG